jgi:hypothetical protein
LLLKRGLAGKQESPGIDFSLNAAKIRAAGPRGNLFCAATVSQLVTDDRLEIPVSSATSSASFGA